MNPTLNRSRPRHDSGEEFASSYQPLSKPSLLAPPTKPRYRTHACIQLPATTSHWYLPSVTTLSVPSNRVIIILPIGRSYPVFPLCWLKAFDKELQLPFSARAASLSFSILCPNRCFSARLWACWLGLLLFLLDGPLLAVVQGVLFPFPGTLGSLRLEC